jgi:predicted nucleic acid-binding protein
MFLVDTNIFLEILLEQDKKENCKRFLNNNIESLTITDFSLHSIGIILFKYGKEDVFRKFVEDIVTNIKNLSLPVELYNNVVDVRKNLTLDFDDAYQYTIAKYYGLKIVTMDKDFGVIKDINVLFLQEDAV